MTEYPYALILWLFMYLHNFYLEWVKCRPPSQSKSVYMYQLSGRLQWSHPADTHYLTGYLRVHTMATWRQFQKSNYK